MTNTFTRFSRFHAGLLASALVLSSLFGAACNTSKNELPNTLHLPIEAKIKGLDPVFADDTYSGTEASLVYEGLLQYAYLKRPYVLEANLAEEMPRLSADRTTYTFHIKKGVLFQDDPCFKETQGKGRELTADDFVYSWKRLSDPKTVSPGWWIFDGKIAGINAWHDEAAKTGTTDYAKPVEGFKALDRYTLQVKLIKPSAQFLFNMAQQFSFVVPKEAVEAYGKEFQNHAVGTGPFRLKEYNGASKIVWLRNPTFRKELYPSEGGPGDKEAGRLDDAGKPIPFVDEIVMHVFEERQPMWLTFLSGKLDAAIVPKDSFDDAIGPDKELKPELKKKSLTLHKYPEADTTHLSFNMADPLVGKNKFLRQALSVAYDTASMIRLFYNGRGIQAEGPIPPGLSGYDEAYRNPYVEFNIAKAKELLAKAGYPEGKGLPTLEYVTQSDSTMRQWAEFDQKQFAAIGVNLKINAYSWPEFDKSVKNRHGQLYAFAWQADYPDGEDFLQLFYSKNASPGPNDANYDNPAYDRLYEKALTLGDSLERTAIYKQMVQILAEDCPWIFQAHRVGYALVQPWIRNYKPHDFDLGKAKYFRVDTTVAANKK